MVGEKIEFYGKELTILAISKKIGISRDTLYKYYKQTEDIYEAEKICRKIIEEKQASLIEYKGENLAIQTIAKREGIKDAKTLKKYYEQTGNIYQAIEKCNQSKIEYNGDKKTLDAIARSENLKRDTLEKYYNKTKDIYEAVKICLDIKQNAEKEKIDYKGEKKTKTSVAKELGMSKGIFFKYYEQAKSVEGAVELYNKAMKKKEEAKILYKGKLKFLKSIAREENISETTLTRYIKKYDTIEKAVFMAQIQRQKKQTVKVKNKDINLYDLSVILGVKYTELINMINKGMSVEQIKEQNKSNLQRNKLKQKYIKISNGQTLLEYCVDNGLNYAFMYRAINTYKKTIEQATKEYKNNGSKMPKHWIFEKYGLLLRHLMIKNKIDIQKVVEYMRKEQISMDEAIEKHIIIKNAKKADLDNEWLQEVYAVLTDPNMEDDYEEFKKAFYIDKKEEDCVFKSYNEVQNIERKLILFEIVEAIRENTFTLDEMTELLQIYQIKSDEIETMFLDLYGEYKGKIAKGEYEPEMKRRNIINEITRKWYFLTEEERKSVIEINKISTREKEEIIQISKNIVKYKNMLKSEIGKEK